MARRGGAPSSIATVYVQVTPSFQGATQAITQGMRNVAGPASTAFGQAMSRGVAGYGGKAAAGFSKSMGRVLKGGAVAAAATVGTILYKGFQRFTAIENATATMKGLGNSIEDIESVSKSALAAVKGTSFGLGDAMKAGSVARSSGVSLENMTDYLSRLSNVATVAQVPLNEISSIISKVQTSGVAQTLEIQQLSDRGISIWQKLAADLDIDQIELRKMVSNRELTADMLYKSLDDLVGNSAAEVGNTLTGMIANFGAAQGRLGEKIIIGLAPAFKILLTEGIAFTDMLSQKLGPVMEQMSEKWLPKLQTFMTGKGELWGGQFAEALPVLQDYAASAADFVKETGPVFMDWFREVQPIISTLTSTIAENADVLVPLIANAWLLFKAFGAVAFLVKPMVIAFTFLRAIAAGAAFSAVVAMGPVGLIAGAIVGLGAAIFGIYKNWDAIKAGASDAAAWVSDKFDGAVTAVSNGWNGFIDNLKGDGNGKGGFLQSLGNWSNEAGMWTADLGRSIGSWAIGVKDQIVDTFSAGSDWVMDKYNSVTDFVSSGVETVKGVISSVGDVVDSVVTPVTNVVNTAVGAVVDSAQTIWGAIGPWVSYPFQLAYAIVQNLIGLMRLFLDMGIAVYRGLLETAQAAGSMIVGWIGTGVSAIGGFFSWLGGSISSLVSWWVGIIGTGIGLVADYVTGGISMVAGFGASVLSGLSSAASWVVGVVSPIIGWIVDKMAAVATSIGKAFSAAFQFIWTLISPAISMLGTFASTAVNVITPVFGVIGSLLSGIGRVFVSVMKGALGVIVSIVNGITGLVNSAIGGINKVLTFEIAGKSYGKALPLIPKIPVPALATGADVMGPTVALIGEKDPETVVNRGVMNDHLSALTRQMDDGRGKMAGTVIEKLEVNVTPPEGTSVGDVADEVIKRINENV